MLGVLKTWWPRKSFVFFLRLISPQRSRELTRMKQRLTRWLPARHLATTCLYLELFILFSSACSKQSKQYCRVFEQKRYFSIHLKPYGHTPQLYSTCAPRTLYTCSDIRTHTVCAPHAYCTRLLRAPYAQTARTVRTHRAHRTHTTRAPYAHPARTPRTPRTHTPHAPCAPLLVPER